jgi:hypothetical protein
MTDFTVGSEIRRALWVAAGFSLRLHRREAYTTGWIATQY